MRDVGADDPRHGQLGVEQDQHRHPDRAGPHRGDGHEHAQDHTEQNRQPANPGGREALGVAGQRVQEPAPEQQRHGGEDQRHPQHGIDERARLRAVAAEQGEHEQRGDGRGHASRGEPPGDGPVHRLVAPVHGSADDLRQSRVQEVGAYRGRGVDAEQQHQERRHQRAAAHAREAHQRAHEEAGQRVERVDDPEGVDHRGLRREVSEPPGLPDRDAALRPSSPGPAAPGCGSRPAPCRQTSDPRAGSSCLAPLTSSRVTQPTALTARSTADPPRSADRTSLRPSMCAKRRPASTATTALDGAFRAEGRVGTTTINTADRAAARARAEASRVLTPSGPPGAASRSSTSTAGPPPATRSRSSGTPFGAARMGSAISSPTSTRRGSGLSDVEGSTGAAIKAGLPRGTAKARDMGGHRLRTLQGEQIQS